MQIIFGSSGIGMVSPRCVKRTRRYVASIHSTETNDGNTGGYRKKEGRGEFLSRRSEVIRAMGKLSTICGYNKGPHGANKGMH